MSGATKAKESLALELLQPELWQVWRGWHHFPRGIGAWAGSHSEVAVCGEGWAGWRGCAGPGDREASACPCAALDLVLTWLVRRLRWLVGMLGWG